MERKGSSTAVVTKELVATALRTATTTSREEQALRMRYGASVDKKAPLPQAHNGNETLADELLLIEMQLLRGLKAHRAPATTHGPEQSRGTVGLKAAVKSKITAKLSKK